MGNSLQTTGIIFLSGLLLLWMVVNVLLLWPRFQYQTGISHMKRGSHDSALAFLGQARDAIPEILAPTLAQKDLLTIHTNTGIILHDKAFALWKENGSEEAITHLYEQSHAALEKAVAIDGAAYIPAYWLARAHTALEVLYENRFPDRPSPFNAQPLYERAIALRPSSITAHYAFARYLNHINDRAGLARTVREMARIYPPVYHRLKKDPFFTSDLVQAVKKGLQDATTVNVTAANALTTLVDLYVAAGDPGRAIEYYEKRLALNPRKQTVSQYMEMGRLHLLAGRPEAGQNWFVKALDRSDDFESIFSRIHNIYRQAGHQESFIRFGMALEETGTWPPALDLEIARAWMEQKQNVFARTRLNRLNDRQPDTRAHLLLARMAEAEKDWHQMEIHARKAAALDPDNSQYYIMAARALQSQKKYRSAEDMVTLALTYSRKPDAGLYNLRAWLRWHQKQYPAALADWKKAFELQPDRPDYAYQAALACEQAWMFKEGMTYIQKALALAPDRQKYKDLQARLRR